MQIKSSFKKKSCHFLLQGIPPDPGIKLASPAWQADSLLLSHLKTQIVYMCAHTHMYTHTHTYGILKKYIFNTYIFNITYLIDLKNKVFQGIKYS